MTKSDQPAADSVEDHISAAEFEAYLLGLDLPDGLAETIESHVALCRDCAQLGEEIDVKLNGAGDRERDPCSRMFLRRVG